MKRLVLLSEHVQEPGLFCLGLWFDVVVQFSGLSKVSKEVEIKSRNFAVFGE